MLVTLYFLVTYTIAFGIANSKAKKELGWNTQLLITLFVFPVAIPFIVVLEFHNYLNKRLKF
jgi:hypothetical protein